MLSVRRRGVAVARPRQPLLSRERIVTVATTILDQHGLEALSTRRLATELGVSAPSLYNHFATKEEILDAIGETVIAQIDLSMFERERWPQALIAWARAYRAALVGHPNLVPFVSSGPARRPAALRLADAVYGALVNGGWPPSQATQIGAAMRYFVTGSALASFSAGFADDPQVYGPQYPHLHDAHRLRRHRQRIDEGAFEMGLRALVDGLRSRHRELPADGPATLAVTPAVGPPT
jgi:AcrR family transcriptional regulator